MSAQTVKFEYDPGRNILFTEDDFAILTETDVEAFWDLYRGELERVGRRVHLVTNIDGLYIKPEMNDFYGRTAKGVSGRWFINFARYGSTALGRLGVADAARKADFVTSVHKSREEAVAAVLAQGEGR